MILVALLLLPLASLHAAELHVAPKGNDANPGTEAKPFATIQAGVNKLQPGDTLLIHGGVYRETVTFPASGAEGQPITVKATPGEKVVVTGCDPVTDWQSAVLRFASDVAEMNADRSGQQAPRHQKTTDPLMLDCSVLAEKPGYDAASPGIQCVWTFARNIQDGNWLRFNQVPLGDGYRRFRVVYGTTSAGPQSFEVRLDQLDGPVVAQAALPQTQQTPVGTIGSDAWVHVYGEVVCDCRSGGDRHARCLRGLSRRRASSGG